MKQLTFCFTILALLLSQAILAQKNSTEISKVSLILNTDYLSFLEKVDTALNRYKAKSKSSKEDYQDLLFKKAWIANLLGQYDIANRFIQQVDAKNTKFSAFEMAHLATNMAINQEDFEQGKKLLKQSEKLIKTAVERAAWYDNLALLYLNQEQYEKADSIISLALPLKKQQFGENHIEFAGTLFLQAKIYTRNNNFKKSESNLTKVENIYEEHLTNLHPLKANLLNEKGYLYFQQNQYYVSRDLFEEAKTMWQQTKLITHPEYIDVLNHLGMVLTALDDYASADLALNEAHKLAQQFYPKNRIQAWVFANQAELAFSKRDYKEALTLSQEANKIFKEKKLWKSVGKELFNQARYLEGKRSWAEADSLYKQSKHLLEKHHYDNSITYISILSRYSSFQKDENKYAAADRLLQKALNIAKNWPNKNNRFYNMVLVDLGNLYNTWGKFEESEQYFLETIRLEKEKNNVEGVDYFILLQNTAALYAAWGKKNKAVEYYQQSIPQNINYIKKVYAGANQTTRSKIKANLYVGFYQFTSFCLSHDVPAELHDYVQDILLLIKNLSLDYTIDTKSYIKNNKEEYKKWTELQGQLSEAWQMSQSERAAKKINLKQLEATKDQLESQLIVNLQQIPAILNQPLSAHLIRQKLQAHQATIDIFYNYGFDGQKWTNEVFYFAVINRPEWQHAKVIKLLEKEPLKNIITPVDRKGTITLDYLQDPELGYELYQAIWQPLEEHLEGVNTIYWSPAALFQRISLAGIATNPAGTEHLGERYHMTYCSDFRNWLKPSTATADKTIVALGDAQYSIDTSDWKNLMDTLPAVEAWKDKLIDFAYTDIGERPRARTGHYFKQLPETGEEVEKINAHLSNKAWETRTYLNALALEEHIKQYTGLKAPRILHIATHGFYHRKSNDNKLDFNAFMDSKNPMFRIGIALTGANHTLQNKSLAATEDGILTAYEISQMDLRQTKLVVLSACESAKGDIDATEGVYGFYRAFRMAGADQAILSLWSVETKATALLMQYFYEYYAQNENAAISLAQAQRKLKKIARYQHPKYWAGFILID